VTGAIQALVDHFAEMRGHTVRGTWSSPSGSRWEPTPDVGLDAVTAPTVTTDESVDGGRGDAAGHRRSPVLLVLVALLSIGGAGAGTYAYERSAGDTAPAATATGGSSGQPGVTDQGPRRGHSDGDRGRDGFAVKAPGTDGDR